MERKRENYKIQVVKSAADGDYRWRITDRRNGKIVGAASEGYTSEKHCVDNLYTITGWVPDEDA